MLMKNSFVSLLLHKCFLLMARNNGICNTQKSIVKLSATLPPERKLMANVWVPFFVSCYRGLTKMIH